MARGRKFSAITHGRNVARRLKLVANLSAALEGESKPEVRENLINLLKLEGVNVVKNEYGTVVFENIDRRKFNRGRGKSQITPELTEQKLSYLTVLISELGDNGGVGEHLASIKSYYSSVSV